MSRGFKAGMLMICVILQQTIFAHFTIFSLIPNYTFIVLIAMCVASNTTEDVAFAGAAGFFTDVFTGAPIGLNTLIYIYISIAVIAATEKMYIKRVGVVVVVFFAASVVCELLFGIFSTLLRGAGFDFTSVMSIILPVSVINSIIFIPVYLILSHLRFEKKRKGIRYERQI